MEINEPRVREVGGKVRRVGDDAGLFLERMSPKLAASLQQNQVGLASLSTLKKVVEQLEGHTKGLINISHTMGDNMVTAANNHELTDIRKARSFAIMSPRDEGGN